MDLETAKKTREEAIKYIEKLLGPMSPECEELMKTLKLIDLERIVGVDTHVTNHYNIEDRLCIIGSLARGYFEGKSIDFNENDVFFTSFPKSGTTWLQMIALHAIYDCDTEKVKSLNVDMEMPTLELPECSLKVMKERPSPRYIKSHLPYTMLPSGNCNKSYKILHITRNPKDLAVSMFHFYTMLKGFTFFGDMKSILTMFLNDALIYAPFDKHCLSYWEHRNDKNVLFLTYEQLHKDPVTQVRRICKFLGKDFSDEQIYTIIRATSFNEMASNPNAHHGQWANSLTTADHFNFMRKGKIGDWKNHFDDEMNKKFDEWIEERFGHTDIKFDYE